MNGLRHLVRLAAAAMGLLVALFVVANLPTNVLFPERSVGGRDQVRRRIELDRAYVHALRDGHAPDDPRIGPSATFGKDWLPGMSEWQRQQLAQASRDVPAS